MGLILLTIIFRPKVLLTLSSEQGKLQHSLATLNFPGYSHCNLASALQIAQLVLKNRQNANQRQRLVVFIGSPIPIGTLEMCTTIGKMLKKNGVSLDLISIGHVEENAKLVTALLASVAGLDQKAAETNIYEALLETECHLLEVRPGDSLVDALKSSPILLGSDNGAGGNGGDFGMDGDLDPELAMVFNALSIYSH